MRNASTSDSDSSVWIMNSRVKSGHLGTGAEVRARFARAKASRCAGAKAFLKAVFLTIS